MLGAEGEEPGTEGGGARHRGGWGSACRVGGVGGGGGSSSDGSRSVDGHVKVLMTWLGERSAHSLQDTTGRAQASQPPHSHEMHNMQDNSGRQGGSSITRWWWRERWGGGGREVQQVHGPEFKGVFSLRFDFQCFKEQIYSFYSEIGRASCRERV